MTQHGTALALGGGGARGVAHIGVIEALINGGIVIDHLFGVSIGSVVAAAFAFAPEQTATALQPAIDYLRSPVFQRYAREFHGHTATRDAENAGPPASSADTERPHWLDRAVGYLRASRGFHRVLTTPSLLPGRILEQIISTLLPDADVADARIPLTIVAVDLVTGREVQITKGPLRAAVLGSASLPGIFPPVPYGGCLLADIGVISPVPCRAAFQADAGYIIAVDVTHQPVRTRSFHTAFDVLLRLEDVASSLFLNAVLDIADTTIKPDVARLPWSDFSSVDATIEAGRRAATAAIPGIRSAIALAAGGLPKASPVAGITFTDESEPRRTA